MVFFHAHLSCARSLDTWTFMQVSSSPVAQASFQMQGWATHCKAQGCGINPTYSITRKKGAQSPQHRPTISSQEAQDSHHHPHHHAIKLNSTCFSLEVVHVETSPILHCSSRHDVAITAITIFLLASILGNTELFARHVCVCEGGRLLCSARDWNPRIVSQVLVFYGSQFTSSI